MSEYQIMSIAQKYNHLCDTERQARIMLAHALGTSPYEFSLMELAHRAANIIDEYTAQRERREHVMDLRAKATALLCKGHPTKEELAEAEGYNPELASLHESLIDPLDAQAMDLIRRSAARIRAQKEES